MLLLAATCFCVPGWAKPHGKGHGPHANNRPEQAHGVAAPEAASHWRPSDAALIRQYYTVPSLPPGLQKKLARTGSLPPGWQKKMQPLPPLVEQRLPALCNYCERGVVDQYAVIYDKRTRVVLDVLNLISDLRR